MLEYNSYYQVLICPLHQYAVSNPDQHLRHCHGITGQEKEALLNQWKSLPLVEAEAFIRPPGGEEPKEFLSYPSIGYSCQSCSFLTTEWANMQNHLNQVHQKPTAPRSPTRLEPSSNAKIVFLQSFFSYPHIKWFIVKDSVCSLLANDQPSSDGGKGNSGSHTGHSEGAAAIKASEVKSLASLQATLGAEETRDRDGSRLRELQRIEAPSVRMSNAKLSLWFRLPPEIRQQIYELALPAGITYHIIDLRAPIEPDFSNSEGSDEHDRNDVNGVLRIRDAWEDNLEENAVGQHFADENSKLRTISMPKGTTNLLSLLKCSSQINAEATPVFYGRNQFRVHSGTADFSTALQFLSMLSPTTQKCITSFGVMGLQPYEASRPRRYGVYPPNPAIQRKWRLYLCSENAFLVQHLPQLSLKELTLGFDLTHIRIVPGYFSMKVWSPQASWLNKFLRLPLERININFSSLGWKYVFGYVPPLEHLIEALNHVDGQTRIRAKNERDDHFKPNDTWEDQQPEQARQFEQAYGPTYRYNDIWA